MGSDESVPPSGRLLVTTSCYKTIDDARGQLDVVRLQPISTEVRIAFSRADTLVAEQFLDAT